MDSESKYPVELNAQQIVGSEYDICKYPSVSLFLKTISCDLFILLNFEFNFFTADFCLSQFLLVHSGIIDLIFFT